MLQNAAIYLSTNPFIFIYCTLPSGKGALSQSEAKKKKKKTLFSVRSGIEDRYQHQSLYIMTNTIKLKVFKTTHHVFFFFFFGWKVYSSYYIQNQTPICDPTHGIAKSTLTPLFRATCGNPPKVAADKSSILLSFFPIVSGVSNFTRRKLGVERRPLWDFLSVEIHFHSTSRSHVLR